MPTNATQAVFDLTAATYNNDRARLIPGHDAFYGTALALVPANAENITDLGAGSGILTGFLRQRFPAAHIHLLDFSAAMLELAKQRFPNDARLTFEQADYTRTPLPLEQDAVVSALSIHHLDDMDKRALMPRVFAALKPGGVFLNAEQVAAPTPELEAAAKAQWLVDVQANGATGQQITDSLLRQQEDRCATVDDQLVWMREAGFVDVSCRYEHGRFAVLYGKRP